ncbi:Intracellular serine protease [Streptomyces sp. YIM 130001]|uniref:S8 family serine peptidase n=1 Tax=Streptomyces sp. YIM 130001 TaxID=2259644 RepID=UPI000E653406|nr:S8 family serine peptidase [Streptomyces sp. YIM 130001]RII17613.1 Intracellular serine protease [Streptomyces sp. YIM 130001]
MRASSRTALGAATAAALAITLAMPSAAAPGGDAPESRPLVGSEAADVAGQRSTVTLVTGDRVLVTTDSDGRSTAAALPRADGSRPLLQTRQSGDDLYVYPEGAAGAVADDLVDEQLFNVTGLVRQGYDDAHAKSLPLIALYDESVEVARSAPAAPRGATRTLVLAPVDGVALEADKKKATDFWSDVTRATSRATAGLKKLWLDGRVETNLDRSTRQVHAPEAWQSGYDGKGTEVAVLDTGADARHPDLDGRITAEKNFTDSGGTEDNQGHGTHTISTVGGSGAASDGAKKGVAPGTDLLNGKVLNDQGFGQDSWIIAGMQWAVEQQADVVSMSLGSPEPTDCTDPMSTAAEQLAADSGTLFVVAAGNTGPSHNTVSSPGCTPGVLTVGAVDRDDSTAPFSSRGPAVATHTLKPEIAAPGVGISAAAAGGRDAQAYRSMSGTSMAAPHVAGAAAILKQRHPDYSPQQLKAALVGSAESGLPGDVRETGAGRLDVAAATEATVLGAPAVQGGTFNWPQDPSDRTTVEMPYTNTGDRPVTLSLSVEDVTGNDGSRVRSKPAKLGDRKVTVAAGETVRVPLAVDPTARLERSQYGDVTGRIRATAKGVTLSTPFALYVQPETVTLRVKLVDRAGDAAAGSSSLDVISTDTADGERRFNDGATDQTYRLRPGNYFLSSFVTTPDAGEGATLTDSVTYLGRPQLELKKDTTVVLDARAAHRLAVATDRPTETRAATLAFSRTWDDTWLHAGSLAAGSTVASYYASVEGRAADGDFEFGSYWRQYAPLIDEFAVVGGPTLHPVSSGTGSANLDGTGRAPLVDAGSGSADELADAGVESKLALVEVGADSSVSTIAQDAKEAGAEGLVLHRATPGRWQPAAGLTGAPLPVLAVEKTEARELTDRLGQGPVTLRWKAESASPYVYNLGHTEDGTIRTDRTYRDRDSRLGRVDSTYHAMGASADYLDSTAAYRPDGSSVYLGSAEPAPVPGERTEYYTPGSTAWDHVVSSSFPFGEFMIDQQRTHRPGKERKESWYDSVIAPTAPRDTEGEPLLAAERQANLIGFSAAMWGDGAHHAEPGSFGDIGNLKLYRDGKEIGTSGYPSGVFDVPADDGAYELRQSITKTGAPAEVWQRSTSVETAWTFRSKADPTQYSQPLPILFPRCALPEDGLKTLAAKNGQRIRLTATGHAGYTPEAVKSASLAYSYDEGKTWTDAAVSVDGRGATATVNHAGASGLQVWLRTELTDTDGNSVRQTVARAYDVR